MNRKGASPWSIGTAMVFLAVTGAAAPTVRGDGPSVALEIPAAPRQGYTIKGWGFAAESWIWIDVNDMTDGSQPVHGPDAFQPFENGTFESAGPSALSCGHAFQATAFVDGRAVVTSSPVTPACAPAAGGAATADPNATAATKATYDFLKSAPDRPDRRLVIGQALRGWDFNQPVDEPVTALTNAGLPAPKFLEVDVTAFGVTPQHDQELYGLLINHAAQGGLVGITYHADNPFTGGSAWDLGGVNLAELGDPANPRMWAGQRWQTELDKAADVLQNLQAAGAVVLFRPLHESNGSWFWWGQADPGAFQATWRGVFNYLTFTKGLHNLLWVYSGNRNLGGDLYNPTRLYPGDDLVDVVGLDIYDDDLSDADGGEPGYAAMLALGKPFAITEYGAAGGHDGALQLANSEVIQRIKVQYPATVLASAWYSQDGDNWQISDKPDAGALLLDPWAVTR